MKFKDLKDLDPEIYESIHNERQRINHTLELIASENFVSPAIMEAQGSVLTNKYAEGYPGQRYYGGCKYVDVAESLAIERAKSLFGADHVNVQPHSGTQANIAAYLALLKPGDRIMGMKLSHGGHLTHGAPASFSGKWYKFFHYGVARETERLDYDYIEELARRHKPKLIVAGASSYPRSIDFERFRRIADTTGSYLVVDMAHIAGLVAANLHPSPVLYADVVTSSTHKTLRGPRSGFILCRRSLASKIDAAVFPGIQGGPQMHAIAAKAIAFFEAMQPEFTIYQKAVLENANLLASELQQHGLRLVSGGTDNHLILVDLSETGITGKAAEEALENTGILVNRNTIPFDTKPPPISSGIRLGTPAVTTRGFGAREIKQLASLILRVLSSPGDRKVEKEVSEEVASLCRRFPIPETD